MKLKGDHLKSVKSNTGEDPWDEFGPVVWIARLVGQGSGGTITNICTSIISVLEAVVSFTWIVFGHRSENTLNRVTEDGQVLILYLTASWSALNAALLRKDEDIMNILKTVPLGGKYKPWNSYKKIAFKLILLIPFITFNWIFSREIVYKSDWTITVFYLPLVQLVFAQLQMTTILDMLTRKMDQLTQELPKCLGIIDNIQYKHNSRRCTVMEQTVFHSNLMEPPANLFKAGGASFDREMLVKLISGHALLLKAGTLVNSSFGLQTLFSLGRTFIVVTFNFFLFIKRELIYYIKTGAYLDLITHSFSIIAIITIHLTELWSLVSSGDNFSKNAETFTKNLFTAAIEDDTEILAEMDIVKCHVASRKDDNTITAYGFLSVDYSLICCMLGAITTYMVIIIQIGNGQD